MFFKGFPRVPSARCWNPGTSPKKWRIFFAGDWWDELNLLKIAVHVVGGPTEMVIFGGWIDTEKHFKKKVPGDKNNGD